MISYMTDHAVVNQNTNYDVTAIKVFFIRKHRWRPGVVCIVPIDNINQRLHYRLALNAVTLYSSQYIITLESITLLNVLLFSKIR